VGAQVTGKRRRQLERIVAAGTSEQRMVRRARIVLAAADGTPNAAIAAELGCSVGTVRTWRGRFARRGVAGLFDRPRSGRPPVHGPSARLAVVATATADPPDGQTVWSRATVAEHRAERGREISPATVGRVLAEAEVRPHRVRGWLRRADDSAFWEEAGQVCRLSLCPPAGTLLVSVDEKTGIPATTRTYPEIPMRPGRAVRREFADVRHGTVSIIAAMDVATGQVIMTRIGRNTAAAFIAFLVMLDEVTDPALRIHLIMDNGSSHTARATTSWLTAHPRFAVTHTPQHASWLNIVEQWFGVLTRRLLRRGDVVSRDDLEAQIIAFTIRHNRKARPYRWSYDADAEHAQYLERHPRPSSPAKAA
jgi:transposase